MNLHCHSHSSHRLLLDAARSRARDPTGTTGLRIQFRAEAQRRLSQLRSATYAQLVEQDFLSHKNDPLTQMFGPGVHHESQTFNAFIEWFKHAAQLSLVATPWWNKYLGRAFASGLRGGSALIRNTGPLHLNTDPPASYLATAKSDVEGIAATLVSAVTRTLAANARARKKPLVMHRAVLAQLNKIGAQRLSAFANVLTVQTHNAGRLAVYRAAGIDRVGVIPETLPRPVVRKRDHFHRDQEFESPLVGEVVVRAAQARWRKRWAELAAQYGETAAAEMLQQEIEAEVEQLTGNIAEFKAKLSTESEEFVARRKAEGALVEAARQRRELELEQSYIEKLAAKAEAALFKEPEGDVDVLTAGDDLVCPECEEIATNGPYTLGEAEDLIPAHPNCRCSIVPAGVFSLGELLGESSE